MRVSRESNHGVQAKKVGVMGVDAITTMCSMVGHDMRSYSLLMRVRQRARVCDNIDR